MELFKRIFTSKKKPGDLPNPPGELPQRNDSCWCGSGLKYKKCHLEQDRLYLEQQKSKERENRKSCSPVFG